MTRKADRPHVTICLTTIHRRLEGVAETIRSLLEQDYPEFDVRLYVSREPFLLDEGVRGVAPEGLRALERGGRFRLLYAQNVGSYRKFAPFLAEQARRPALFATADDDTLYPPDWLARLVEAHDRHRCVVCYRGHFILRRRGAFTDYRRWMTHGIARNPDLMVLPTGKDGVLYDTRYFHPRAVDTAAALRIAPTADDLWIKWHTAALGVPVYTLNTRYATDTLETRPVGDGLYERFNRGGANDATVAALSDYARAVFGFDRLAGDAPA